MGIVIKQASRAALFSYLGAALGFLTVWYVNRNLLSPEQNGLLNLLISITIMSGSLSNLGFTGVITRMFPHFRSADKKHHGFLFYPIAVSLLGFIVFVIIYFLFADSYALRNQEKSQLLADYLFYLLPLTFFWSIYNVFDAYSRSVYHTSAGVFIKEVLLRIMVLVGAYCYYKNWISFPQFVFVYCACFCSVGIIMGIYLWWHGEFSLKPSFVFLTPSVRKEMIYVACFSIITGLSSLLISTIDKIIVNDKLGLSAAGIFAIATYFGSVIHIPSRSIGRISSSIIADAWKINNLDLIRSIYHKTCLNQLIIGSFLLIGIWANIDSLFSLMPREYSEGKYVILLIGLGYLIDMATGANGIIIATSRYFRYDTYFMLLLVIVTVISNMILIPAMGLTGAALASCITYLLFNLLRYFFIWNKFGFQPYDGDFIKVIAISVLAYFVAVGLPDLDNAYFDILFKGSVVTILFWFLIVYTAVSADINTSLKILWARLRSFR